MATDRRVLYADASALVKLVVAEEETAALERFLAAADTMIVTSRVALIEVTRAAIVAKTSPHPQEEAALVLDRCVLIDVDAPLVRRAATLARRQVRTLDAIHLATALDIGPDAVLVYDRRLAEAVSAAGLDVIQPGRELA